MLYINGWMSCATLLLLLNVCGGEERFLDRKIKGPITITSEWTEIKLNPPLKPEREEHDVVLYLAEPYTGDLLHAGGVNLPDGSVVMPEVQIVDTEGNIYTLKATGFRGKELMRFTLRGQLDNREYRSVRIRSAKPINCKEIIWSNWNWKDID
jgi:hypothetical protein